MSRSKLITFCNHDTRFLMLSWRHKLSYFPRIVLLIKLVKSKSVKVYTFFSTKPAYKKLSTRTPENHKLLGLRKNLLSVDKKIFSSVIF